MASMEDPMGKIPPQHQDIVNSTWSQLLNAEGGVQNLAVDLLKSFAGQSLGGNTGGGSGGQAGGDFMSQLGGLAGMLGGDNRGSGQRQNDSGNAQNQQQQQQSGAGGVGGGGGEDFLGQLGGLAGQFLNNRNQNQGNVNNNNNQGSNDGGQQQQEQNSNRSAGGGGGASFLDQFGGIEGIAGMVSKGLGNQGGSGGGGNLMQSLGGLGSLAALAGINLKDPSSLLHFFLKTPVANDAANPDNSSRDIYKTIKNVIFSLLGSKLPAEDFQENPENKSAWKGYLGAVANALRKLA